MISFVIQGLGFMGQVHAHCLREASNATLVGIVETDLVRAEAFLREAGMGDLPVSDSLDGLPEGIQIDVVDICLPTDLHRAAAEAAFTRGYHVFCEKPLALNEADGEAIRTAAARAGRQLMVGHCLRFWPEYEALKGMIDSAEAGRLLALNLFRRAPRPDYTAGNWADAPERCLGAALDLHIHDTDMLHFLLGSPSAVSSAGVLLPTGWDHIQTQYHYPDCAVQAEGGWNYPKARPFQMGYSALFERGSLDYDTTAAIPFRKCLQGKPTDPANEDDSPAKENADGLIAYRRQLEYFADCIESGTPVAINSGSDAMASLRTVLAEIQSAKSKQAVQLIL